MTDQTQNQDRGVQQSLDEAEQAYNRAREEQKTNSRFAQMDPGTAEEFEFTGIVYARHSSGTDPKTGAPFESDKLDMELTDVTPDGVNKVLSFGVGNKIVPELIKLLKSGVRKATISRTGEGTNTRYTLLVVKQKKAAGVTVAAAPAAAPAQGQ